MIDPANRYVLWLLLAIPALALWRFYTQRRQRLPLNVAYHGRSLWPTWRRSTRWVVPTLRLFGMGALIVAVARPYDWHDSQPVDSEGMAIELVIDRSGSMLEDDYVLNGRRVPRLNAVTDAAARFVLGDSDVGSRQQDLIGLVSFARFAEADCPLTLDHEQVVARLEQIEAAADYRQDGTAIGDGLALAVAELQSLDKSLHLRDPTSQISRVVVLLTDGEQNAGELRPADAARLARHYGIRVYAIGLQPPRGRSVGDPAARFGQVDELQQIAESTGGIYFSVSDTESLQSIYQSIDALERATLTQRRLTTRREWAIEWFHYGPFGLPPIALVALFALAAETCLSRIVYLRVL